eukprot:3809580-Amphidinium_carterae.1
MCLFFCRCNRAVFVVPHVDLEAVVHCSHLVCALVVGARCVALKPSLCPQCARLSRRSRLCSIIVNIVLFFEPWLVVVEVVVLLVVLLLEQHRIVS